MALDDKRLAAGKIRGGSPGMATHFSRRNAHIEIDPALLVAEKVCSRTIVEMGIKVRRAERPTACVSGEDGNGCEEAPRLVASIPPGPQHGAGLLRLIAQYPTMQRSLLEIAATQIDNDELNWLQGQLYTQAKTSAVFDQKPSLTSIDLRSSKALSARYSSPATSAQIDRTGPRHVLPEDGSLETRVIHLGVSADPRYVNEEFELAREILQVAAIEGFRVDVHFSGDPKQLRSAIEPTLLPFLTISSNEGYEWLEDGGEILADGSVRTLPVTGHKDFNEDLNAIHRQRYVPSLGLGNRIGSAVENHQQATFVHLAKTQGRQQSIFQTYPEGGNHVPGTLPNGEPYVVVGIDTIEYSQQMLGRQRGVTPYLPWDQTVEAFADDLGVKPENVRIVEQPGDFHADMRMALFGNKTVVINDARQAFALETQWMRDDFAAGRVPGGTFFHQHLERKIEEAQRAAEQQAPLEDAAAADLTAAGFTVHRVAGVFEHLEQRSSFLNMESGTNPRGEKFAITAGGDPRAQAYFLAQIKALSLDLDHIHFLAPNIARTLADYNGGANCRMKSEGRLPKRG